MAHKSFRNGRRSLKNRRRLSTLPLEQDRGLLGLTPRYSFEVRKRAQYFEDIPELKLPKVMLDLTTHNSCFRQHRPIAEVVGGRAS